MFASTPSHQLAEIGQRIFADRRLSADSTTSCTSCHEPSKEFADGRDTPTGVNGQRGFRNAPSLLNVAANTTFFWDGRASSLEEQALRPLFNPREHGLNEAQLLSLVNEDEGYRHAFGAVFALDDQGIQTTHIAKAIAAFERTLVSAESSFDRGELSPGAVRGLKLFTGRAQCSSCHRMDGSRPQFADGLFHVRRVGLAGVVATLPQLTATVEAHRGSGGTVDGLLAAHPEVSQLGRYLVTGDPHDIGSWRTPSLRNVAMTAPYMHDGSIATLEDAVEQELYVQGIEKRLNLTPDEKSDLLEFLKSLTSPDAFTSSTARTANSIEQ